MNSIKSIILAAVATILIAGVAVETRAADVTAQEAYEIGVEAYIYTYPLVMMDVSRRQLTNIEAGKMSGRGPMNTFSHLRTFPSAEFREVVRPNFRTPDIA